MRPGARTVGMLIGVALLLMVPMSSGAGQENSATPGSAPSPVSDLTIVEQRDFSLPNRRILGLSPDGRWLATISADSEAQTLCAHATAAIAEAPHCAALSSSQVDPGSVTWSPDGSRLAFAEIAARGGGDSDVWTFEAATGTLVNLTEDEVTSEPGVSPAGHPDLGPVPVDTWPAWSPDGQTLAFARQVWDRSLREAAIYAVPATGGTPTRLHQLEPDGGCCSVSGLRWMPDGKQLVFSIFVSPDDHPANGLWIVGSDDAAPLLVASHHEKLERPFLIEVAPRGDFALVSDANVALGESPFALVNLATGNVEPVERLLPDRSLIPFMQSVAFSPDGSRLLYFVPAAPQSLAANLVVREMGSDSEQTILALDERTRLTSVVPARGLAWATDGTVFIQTGLDTGRLLRVSDAGGDQLPE